jgi:hypothetical protein
MTATLVVAWISAGAIASAQRSETEGIKETGNFVKAGAETSSAVGGAKLQAQNTLTAYNSLVTQPSKDMKGDYKRLLKAVKETDVKVDDARERITKMEATGNTYFAGRAATIKAIQNADLRGQAEQRLSENQKEYVDVMASLGEAGRALQPVRTDLDNQIAYLGSDLTPSAMTSLKPQAEELNERAALAFAKADQAIATANKYFNSMRPTKS